MTFSFDGFASLTGIDVARETLEEGLSFLCWGLTQVNQTYIWPTTIDSVAQGGAAVTDAGSSPTSLLRPGLLMAFHLTTKKARLYDTAGANGLNVLAGPLIYAVNTLKSGTADSKIYGFILVGGQVKVGSLAYNGGAYGVGIMGTAVQTELEKRFYLDRLYYQ